MVDKKLGTEDDLDINESGSITEVEVEKPRGELIREAAEILVTEEGLLTDEEMLEQEEALETDFNANLADFLSADTLNKLAQDLIGSIKSDLESRKDWEETYTDGLKYLGMKFDEARSQPFEGSSGVIHPILAEAVTQFQAQAYKELLPAKGPVKTQILGVRNADTESQADRVREFMNYYIMNVMKEYDPELDQLLFYLPLAGSAFKKVYFDFVLNRAVSKFIPPEDLIVPYESADISSAERITHAISMSKNEIKKQQLTGFYSNIDLPDDIYGEEGDVQKEIDEIQGIEPSYAEDRSRTIYETHTILDLEGFEDVGADGEPTGLKLPYIVTIDRDAGKVLSIRRNFQPEDPLKNKINFFVQYKFLPGLGFYGLGLSHMIGGLSKASTSILRQLIDAGTLANLPAGFKARGMRIRDEAEPLQPGEFRDIDTTGGNLRENLIPLPIKEPSSVLMQLLGLLVDSGKRFAAIADMNVGDMNQAMPVGTTVALLERGTKVMSAIHKRLHYSQRLEFNLLADVFADYLPPEYDFETGSGPRQIKLSDFDERVDIVPISDPNIFSQSQRITMAQELLQMVTANPDVHGPVGIYEAYRRMYAALGVDNIESLLQPPPDTTPMPIDAGIENSNLLLGQPAQAFPEQNHEAHVAAHQSLFLLKTVQENEQIQSLIVSHVMQHLQFLSAQLAEQQMPAEAMQQIEMMQAQITQAPPEEAKALTQQIQIMLDQISSPIMASLTEQFLSSIQMPSGDPLVEIRQKELELKDKELDMEQDQFDEKQVQARENKMIEAGLQQQRIDVQKAIADDKLQLAIDRMRQQADLKLTEIEVKTRQ